MKMQIIQLTVHDDCISVRDKLSWSHAERLLLVWPSDGNVLDRLFDLKLVYHQATGLGSQIGLVTKKPRVHFFAHEIGIPVFDDLSKAMQDKWHMNPLADHALQRRKKTLDFDRMRRYAQPFPSAWADHPITRLLCLCISVVALFALCVVILPGAKVTLIPRVETQSVLLDFIVDPSSTTLNISTGILPTYRQEVIIEGRDTIAASGFTRIPDQYAAGELKFTNNSTQTVTIPVGTIVSTHESVPIQFVTTSSSNVIVGGEKSVSVPARAVKPGESGNLPANSLTDIDADLGLVLTSSNPNATSGGTSATVPSPSENDLQILHQQLESKLKQDALTQMQSYLPDGDRVVLPTMALVETIGETQLPSISDPGDQLELFLHVKFQCQVISWIYLQNMVSDILDEKLPEDYSALPGTLVIATPDEPSQSIDGIYHYSITAKRQLNADIQPGEVIGKISGLTVTEAKDLLSATLPLASQADIRLTPSWWPWLPYTAMRTELAFSQNP